MDFESLMTGVRLAAGAHPNAGAEMCAMEMVAWLEGLPHSDSPACTSPVLAAYVRRLNDGMTNEHRNLLLPYLPRLVGTVAPEFERPRAQFLAWKACTVIVPMRLRARGKIVEAERLEAWPLPTDRNGWLKMRDATYAVDAAAAAAAAYAAAAYADAARARLPAYAAGAGADAAYAAAADADAARARLPYYQAAIAMLDGAIKIGPEPAGFTKPLPEPGVTARQLGMV